MGIRIHKDIGYALTLNQAQALFVENYEEVFELMDYSESNEEDKFFEKLLTYQGDTDKRYFSNYQQKELYEAYKAKKIHFFNVIKQIYFSDELEHILFSTYSLIQCHRYDDNIDYYEAPTYQDSIQYLNRAIYPVNGYIYKGGLNDTDLVPGQSYNSSDLIGIAYQIDSDFMKSSKSDNPHAYSHIMVRDGYFHPAIDEVIYLIAQCSGLLKDTVSRQEFDYAVQPAIITSWG